MSDAPQRAEFSMGRRLDDLRTVLPALSPCNAPPPAPHWNGSLNQKDPPRGSFFVPGTRLPGVGGRPRSFRSFPIWVPLRPSVARHSVFPGMRQ